MRSTLLLLPLLIGVAACGSHTSVDNADTNASGTDINVAAKGDKGEDIRITADGNTGKVSVNLPGFDANVRLPKVMLKDSNFDIGGVKLYPGATVASINVQGDASGTGDNSRVQIIYTAPAEPKPVRDWFAKAFAEKAVEAKISGESLIGKTKDGTPFTMTFSPGKGGATTGTVIIDDKNPA
jgi:hypothetical protein